MTPSQAIDTVEAVVTSALEGIRLGVPTALSTIESLMQTSARDAVKAWILERAEDPLTAVVILDLDPQTSDNAYHVRARADYLSARPALADILLERVGGTW